MTFIHFRWTTIIETFSGHLVARGYPSANTQDFASAMCTVLLEKGNQLDLSLAARAIGSLGKLHRYCMWTVGITQIGMMKV